MDKSRSLFGDAAFRGNAPAPEWPEFDLGNDLYRRDAGESLPLGGRTIAPSTQCPL
jgi:hypothetical protein